MGFSLRNLVQDAATQLNLFDHGRTAASNRADRQPKLTRDGGWVGSPRGDQEFVPNLGMLSHGGPASMPVVNQPRLNWLRVDALERQSPLHVRQNLGLQPSSSFEDERPLREYLQDTSLGTDQTTLNGQLFQGPTNNHQSHYYSIPTPPLPPMLRKMANDYGWSI